jgi:glycosyltransferase involved in cell wall biosynthesis
MRYLEGTSVCALSSVFRLAKWVPEKWLYRVRPFHPNWYDRSALALEARAVLDLLTRTSTVLHFLYGEHSFRWSGRANHLAGHRGRVVATYHQVPSFFDARRKQFAHLRDLDAVILVASNQRAFFEDFLEPGRIFVVPHGVDTQFFHPGPERCESKQVFRCLIVGNNYRDSLLLSQVIDNLNQLDPGKIEFVIVGSPDSASDGPAGNVRHLSGISDEELRRTYQSADVLLLPLDDATACNALLEGMAAGLPIVATDVGGVRDYIGADCAVLVPRGDAFAMSDAVVDLLGDPERRARLGSAARRRAQTEFDWERIAEQVQHVYRKLS